MGFGNAHVKEPSLGAELLGKAVQASAILHSGGDGADAFVFPGQAGELPAKHRGEVLPSLFERFPGFDLEFRNPVESAGIALCRGISLALGGLNMYQHRHMKGFCPF